MLLIKNARILTMAGVNYENGYILIEKGKIIDVGEGSDFKNINQLESKQLKTIDAKGKFVMPGFIFTLVFPILYYILSSV
jgi:imidazolonepropionase-like amidohydrolase